MVLKNSHCGDRLKVTVTSACRAQEGVQLARLTPENAEQCEGHVPCQQCQLGRGREGGAAVPPAGPDGTVPPPRPERFVPGRSPGFAPRGYTAQ